MADVFLETDRLVLRRFTESDVDNLVALDGDPEVMRYLTGGVPTPREQVELEDLPRILGYYERLGGLGLWVAEDRAGTFLGWFSLRPRQVDPPKQVELGYRLTRAAWGQGHATEGSKALMHKGFTEFGVERIYALTMVVNARSRRVMEKCGLAQVRIFHEELPREMEGIEGIEHGGVEYALTRAEWEAQRS
ncbi:MAG: GNAT family N-acetyltransferase [Umezawaea sp.]